MQKKIRNSFITALGAAAILLGLIACDIFSGNGTMQVHMTDAPLLSEDVQGVFITVEGIQYHTSDGQWVTMSNYEGPQTFNLLELTRGDSRLLGELILPAGEYTQIRFQLKAEGEPGEASQLNSEVSTEETGSWIEFGDNETKPLFIPSGDQTGYKASAGTPFTVPLNGTVTVTADFDLRRAVVKSGESGRYILKPVLRLIVNDEAGTIEGNVEVLNPDYRYVIYAFNESYTPGTGDPAEEVDVVTSSFIEDRTDEPDYVLAFLAASSYRLVVAHYNGAGEFMERFDVEHAIDVTAGETEAENIMLNGE